LCHLQRDDEHAEQCRQAARTKIHTTPFVMRDAGYRPRPHRML
jgi:hypothetical protein